MTTSQENLRRYRREWYARNREHAKSKVVARRSALKRWYAELKSQLICSRCPETHPATLEFHHEDRTKKELSVSAAVHSGWSVAKIKAEMEKCSILCSNCHRKLHFDE